MNYLTTIFKSYAVIVASVTNVLGSNQVLDTIIHRTVCTRKPSRQLHPGSSFWAVS